MREKLIYIGYDLFLDLKLYKIPAETLYHLEKKNKLLRFVKIKNQDSKYLSKISIYWGNRITDDIIQKAKNLKWIHFGSIGFDRVNINEMKSKKIMVTNSKGTMESSVMVTILGFMISLSRGLNKIYDLRAINKLSRETFDKYFERVSDLENQVCLIVGMGQVGLKLKKVCLSLGMKVLAIKKNNINNKKNIFSLKQLKNVIVKADYVINLLPLNNETFEIFDRNLFKCMKKEAYFINVGRGKTVNENHLYEALRKKIFAGGALDVFYDEPLNKNSNLLKLQNLIITPHIAGLHNKYWQKESILFERNLDRFLMSKKLINQLV